MAHLNPTNRAHDAEVRSSTSAISGQGEDAYYAAISKDRRVFCIRAEFRADTDEQFIAFITAARPRFEEFYRTAIARPPAEDEPIFAEVHLREDGHLDWPGRRHVQAVQVRYHVPSRALFAAFDHSSVGGALLNPMLESFIQSDSAKLPKAPNVVQTLFSVFYSTWFLLRTGMFAMRLPLTLSQKPSDWSALNFSFPVPGGLGEMAGTDPRARIAFVVLSALAGALPVTKHRPLRVIFTVAFCGTPKQLHNPVGVIPFQFVRGQTTPKSLHDGLRSAAPCAYASYWYLARHTGKYAAETGARGRQWSDVAFSITHFQHVRNQCGGIRSLIGVSSPVFPYSCYASMATFDGKVCGGLSLCKAVYDLDALCELLPGAQLFTEQDTKQMWPAESLSSAL